MDVSQCQLRERPVRTSSLARSLFGPPAAPAHGKDLWASTRTRPGQGSTWLMQRDCAHHLQGKAARTTASIGPSKRVQQSQVALTDNHTETKECFSEGGGIAKYQVSEFQTCFVRV